MGFYWLDWQAEYGFYLACKEQYGYGVWRQPTDDEVATYCMGGEL